MLRPGTLGVAILLLGITFPAFFGCRITHKPVRADSREVPFYEPLEGEAGQVKVVDTMEGLKASILEAGLSEEGRPVRAYILGEGDKNVLLVGGIHGDEPGGETLLYRFVGFISKQPDIIEGYKAIVLPSMNPDGLEYATRFNSRGVDLDMNFPSQDWGANIHTRDRSIIGSSAGSEPEVAAVMKILEGLPPLRALSVQSAAGCITYEGPGAEDLAKRLSERCSLPLEKFHTRPGSLGALLGKDREIPFLTLELEYHHERGQIAEKESERFREALLELFR